MSFEEAKQRFIIQGRTDIELCENGYVQWSKKARFYDKIIKEYFWSCPADVLKRNSIHPKRYRLSKNQIELYGYIKTIFLEAISEYKIFNKNKNYYFVDILIPSKNIIIEYNGDYWHCNPKLYKENYLNKRSKKLAKEIWKYDKIRKEELEKAGYKVLVIWEYDYNNNKEETLNNIKQIILKQN